MTKLTRKDLIQDYLVDNSLFPQDYICSICMNPLIKPIKCKTCICKCCADCIKSWKKSKNSCPFRCTPNGWKGQQMESIKLNFKCYHCSKIMNTTLEELIPHIELCNKNPEAMKKRKLRREYLCGQGHPLELYTWIGYNPQCQECEENNLRSKCSKCNKKYCIKCRPLKCSKNRCNLGHAFKDLVVKQSYNFVCDMCCGTEKQGATVKHDKKCNIVFCSKCFESLPDFLQKYEIGPDKNMCPYSHKLQMRSTNDMKQIKQKCSICTKLGNCFKKCTTCSEIYCNECRPIEINNFKFFQKQVQYRLYENKQNTEYQCFQCQKIKDIVFRDRRLGVTFCQECIGQIHIANDQKALKTISLRFECHNNNSELVYFANKSNVKRKCSGCDEEKNIRLFCIKCQPIKYYCFKCRSVTIQEGCPLKHTLYPSFKIMECLYCEKMKECLQCQECNFMVCQGCCDKEDVEELILKSAEIIKKPSH